MSQDPAKSNPFAKLKEPPIYNWGDQIPTNHFIVKIQAQDGNYVQGAVHLDGKLVVRTIGKISDKVKNPDLPHLPIEETGLKLFVNKIPYPLYQQVIGFFRYVYSKYQSEAAVLLFLNPTLNNGTWRIEAPLQDVTPAHVEYKQPTDFAEQGWYYAGTIHSHAAMSAFHSSTDEKDEDHTNGFHLTVGAQGEIDALFCWAKWKFEMQAEDLIDLSGYKFPPEWKKQVSYLSVTPAVKGSVMGRTFSQPYFNNKSYSPPSAPLKPAPSSPMPKQGNANPFEKPGEVGKGGKASKKWPFGGGNRRR
jgi:hypothetical protein